LGAYLAGAWVGPWLGPWRPAVGVHVPPDRGIGAERPEGGIGLHQGGEVVVVKLVGPVRVLAVLGHEPIGERRVEGDLAAILADGAAQRADGVVALAARGVVPALDGDGREVDVGPAAGM